MGPGREHRVPPPPMKNLPTPEVHRAPLPASLTLSRGGRLPHPRPERGAGPGHSAPISRVAAVIRLNQPEKPSKNRLHLSNFY